MKSSSSSASSFPHVNMSDVNLSPYFVTLQGLVLSLTCGAALGLGKSLILDNPPSQPKDQGNTTITKKTNNDFWAEIITPNVIRHVLGGAALNLGAYLVVPNVIRSLWSWPLHSLPIDFLNNK